MSATHPVAEARSLLQQLTPGDRRLVERHGDDPSDVDAEYFVAYGDGAEDSTLPPVGDARFDVAAPRLVRELLALNADLVDSLAEMVALYDGTRDMLGPTVRHKLARAEAALAKAGITVSKEGT